MLNGEIKERGTFLQVDFMRDRLIGVSIEIPSHCGKGVYVVVMRLWIVCERRFGELFDVRVKMILVAWRQ